MAIAEWGVTAVDNCWMVSVRLEGVTKAACDSVIYPGIQWLSMLSSLGMIASVVISGGVGSKSLLLASISGMKSSRFVKFLSKFTLTCMSDSLEAMLLQSLCATCSDTGDISSVLLLSEYASISRKLIGRSLLGDVELI